MRIDLFLIISTLVLAGVILSRNQSDGYYSSAMTDNINLEQISLSSLFTKIELTNILIDPEASEDLEDFELIGITMHMPDSTSFFEPIFFTPQAGVIASTDKHFLLSPDDLENISETIFAITGKYKGKAIYFPVFLDDLITITDSLTHQYALSVELNNLSNGSFDVRTPCHPDAFKVKIASL